MPAVNLKITEFERTALFGAVERWKSQTPEELHQQLFETLLEKLGRP